ncbi:hypothetical protein DQ04_05531020 [Trypanosoma grayi]|uniref:hypothetical protein n=1 Tax=Trypanosoma grayi TaxID=71804 RepID=UPI0004F47624|nr:hypothetical protein DQ04_05531020 [Trypanosoma grayi]KEG09253.1 hypothetical protein DQ04_05531020 [Trypanosoma grayi]
MSSNVRFNVVAPAPAKKKQGDNPKSILPHDFLLSLHGRRVIVFLSYKDHELEGTLSAVDADKGDIFLDKVVHYAWSRGAAEHARDGTRVELRHCHSAMVNSRYIEMVAPA